MDEHAAHADTNTDRSAIKRQAPGMPRWVRVSLLTIAVLAALFLLLHLTGLAPRHGAGQHMQQHAQVGTDSGR
jgi:hypothetical protein